MLKKLFSLLKRIENKIYPTSQAPSAPAGITSYSQCGEDIIIGYIFYLRGILKPTYIDVGANHPNFINNTALFYSNKCRGINIEANPKLIVQFDKWRPEDINLNVGISATEGELDFYIMQDNTLSSFSYDEVKKMEEAGNKHIETIKVKLVTINSIIEKYCNGIFPDFLSLDVEGYDFDILKSLDFTKSTPKVICVEASDYSSIGAGTRRSDLIDFLVSKGYYEYANTNLNAIMVRRDFWFV